MISRTSKIFNNQLKKLWSYRNKETTTSLIIHPKVVVESSILYKRPIREAPGKVRLGFVPEDWFNFFYKKTGESGGYIFGLTFGIFLLSKEFYVIGAETYEGLSMLVLCSAVVKKYGALIAKRIDDGVDAYEAECNKSREDAREGFQNLLQNEEKHQESHASQLTLIQAKRENIGLQLEIEYRQRLNDAYQQVKNRLEFQIKSKDVEQGMAHKNMIEYVVSNVLNSITPEIHRQIFDHCIDELGSLAKTSDKI